MINIVLHLHNDNTIPVGTTPTQLWADRERKLLKKIKIKRLRRFGDLPLVCVSINLICTGGNCSTNSVAVQTIRVRPGFDTKPGGFKYQVRTRLRTTRVPAVFYNRFNFAAIALYVVHVSIASKGKGLHTNFGKK